MEDKKKKPDEEDLEIIDDDENEELIEEEVERKKKSGKDNLEELIDDEEIVKPDEVSKEDFGVIKASYNPEKDFIIYEGAYIQTSDNVYYIKDGRLFEKNKNKWSNSKIIMITSTKKKKIRNEANDYIHNFSEDKVYMDKLKKLITQNPYELIKGRAIIGLVDKDGLPWGFTTGAIRTIKMPVIKL